jgi:predicted dehydrogenase
LHLWVEKPIALTVADAEAMSAAASAARIKAMTPFGSFVHYFLGDTIDLFRSGRLGRLIQLFAVSTGSYGYASEGPEYHYAVRQPEVSGGWILHHFCHLVDWATEIGGPVESVYCQADTTVPDARPGQEEAVTAILRFRKGGTATLIENQLRHIHIRYAVTGDRGGQFIATSPEARGDDPFLSIETAIDGAVSRDGLNFDQYRSAVADRPSPVRRFLDAIENDLPSPVPLRRAVENIRVCMALRESARIGGAVRLEPHKEPA